MRKYLLSQVGVMFLLVAFAMPVFAQPKIVTTDTLVDDLASAEDARQVRARQMLPLRGAEVAAKVAPLLNDKRDVVSFAALRVLEDVIHETYRASEDEKEQVAQAVFALVAPTASEKQKNIGLRLLPLVVQENHDLSPVAALLADTALREPARTALAKMQTKNATRALCEALPKVEDSFQIDILHALTLCDINNDKDAIMPLLESPSPAVQAAALRALVKTALPELLPHAKRICLAATDAAAFDAWDAWLRLADAIASQGGSYELAMNAYTEILNTTPHLLVKCGAITGMGRFGDVPMVAVIVDALNGAEGAALEPAALEAFRTMQGKAVNEALIRLFPKLSSTMKPGMLALFGDKADPAFLGLVAENARNKDVVIRDAAWDALAKFGVPEAVGVFRQLLSENANDSDAKEKLTSLLYTMALSLRQQGNNEGAGQAYLAVYRSSDNAELRAAALEGIKACPVSEAYDVVLELLKKGDISTLPISAMVGVALNAIAAGNKVEGKKLMAEILPRLTTADAVRHAVHAMRTKGPNPEFARALGYINRWHIVGPFPWDKGSGFNPVFIGEPNVSVNDSYPVAGKTLAWQLQSSDDAAALFNLMDIIGAVENAVAFAYAEIEVAEGGPAQVRVGSDDGIRVWINGTDVLQVNEDQGYDIDQNIADITLKQGRNAILVEITQILGGWAFTARLTHPDGTPFEFSILE